MKKEIKIRTVITSITKDGNYKPKSPLFEIINDGFSPLIINNIYPVASGEGFGISADPIVAEFLLKGFHVEMDTSYFLKFTYPLYFVSAKLIETFITIE